VVYSDGMSTWKKGIGMSIIVKKDLEINQLLELVSRGDCDIIGVKNKDSSILTFLF
jgi:hypothetical protein